MMRIGATLFVLPLLCLGRLGGAWAAESADVQARMDADAEAGRPLVAHVVVALCDNQHQGIVPVPAALGNGQDPKNNLYWGAMYGVKGHLPRRAGWERIDCPPSKQKGVLDRLVLKKEITRKGKKRPVYLVAEAWDGKEIKPAVCRFLELAAGRNEEQLALKTAEGEVTLRAGGAAHIVAYVGHNGLMDFRLARADAPKQAPGAAAQPRSSVVLACKSRSYFLDKLERGGSHPLLMTTGLMCPEAYTFDAAVCAWFAGETAAQVRDRAAAAYAKYQKCGLKGAARLFAAKP